MNILPIAVIALVMLFAGYRFYARHIQDIFGIDFKKRTPAHEKYDGIDYVPARNWLVLFGHHFASIAGAAPVVGPIVALSLWGWGPGIIWIVLGCIFFGGVHDFSALVISVKMGGVSIAEVAKDAISYKAKLLFSIFVLFALILVVSVFVFLCAGTLVKDARIVIPSLGLVPVALLVGVLLYKTKYSQVKTTILGLVLLVGLIILGRFFPLKLGTIHTWILILLGYAYIASIIPVNILLQPRDYLSAFLLFAGIILGYAGIIVSHPQVKLPAFTSWDSGSGWLWPMLFVIVACGAISGFHSLVASGTTAKQLPDKRYYRRIGYGAMIMEGIVAVMAMLVVIGSFGGMDIFRGVLKAEGPIGVFSKGFGAVTMPFLGGYGELIAVVILNAFIFTTLDTATRISRYIMEELTGLKNRWLSTGLIIVASGWLAWSGKWKTIWPVFGASNQLVAALTLFVITCWLLARGKSIKYMVFPAVFMFITTVAALGFQIWRFLGEREWVLLAVSAILLLLAFYMCWETIGSIRKIKLRRSQ